MLSRQGHAQVLFWKVVLAHVRACHCRRHRRGLRKQEQGIEWNSLIVPSENAGNCFPAIKCVDVNVFKYVTRFSRVPSWRRRASSIIRTSVREQKRHDLRRPCCQQTHTTDTLLRMETHTRFVSSSRASTKLILWRSRHSQAGSRSTEKMTVCVCEPIFTCCVVCVCWWETRWKLWSIQSSGVNGRQGEIRYRKSRSRLDKIISTSHPKRY